MRLKHVGLVCGAVLASGLLAGCQNGAGEWVRRVWSDLQYERGWISRKQAIQWVISEDPDLRQRGISVLNKKGYQGLPKTREYIRTMTDRRAERSAVVRGAAIRAQIHAEKDPEVVETLIGVLDDPDPYVRTEACIVLAELEDAKAVDPLIQRLRVEDSSDIRGAAADALSVFHVTRAALALAEFVGDEDFLVAFSCLEGLRNATAEDFGYEPKKWTEWISAQQNPFAKAGQRPPGPAKPEDERGYRLKKWILFWNTDPRERIE